MTAHPEWMGSLTMPKAHTRASRRRSQVLETVVYQVILAASGTAIDQQNIPALRDDGVSGRINSTRHISLSDTCSHPGKLGGILGSICGDARTKCGDRVAQSSILAPILKALDEKRRIAGSAR